MGEKTAYACSFSPFVFLETKMHVGCYGETLKGGQQAMADTGEDREIRGRLEANEVERFRESRQLTTKTKEANRRRARKLKLVDDPKLIPPGLIPKPPNGS
jgi:hypothetical protein